MSLHEKIRGILHLMTSTTYTTADFFRCNKSIDQDNLKCSFKEKKSRIQTNMGLYENVASH